MAEPTKAGLPRRLWRVLAGATLVNLIVIGAGNAYEIGTASRETFATVADVPAAPVAIVLGNVVFPDGRVSSDLYGRLALALELYQRHKVRTVFVSGAARPDGLYPGGRYDEAAVMAKWLEIRGVPEGDIVLDPRGFRTAATMADAVQGGIRDAIVCTQAYHLPRALFLARQAGIHATGVPAAHKPGDWLDVLRPILREALARPESVAEVAFVGVRGRAEPVPGGPKS